MGGSTAGRANVGAVDADDSAIERVDGSTLRSDQRAGSFFMNNGHGFCYLDSERGGGEFRLDECDQPLDFLDGGGEGFK